MKKRGKGKNNVKKLKAFLKKTNSVDNNNKR